MRASNISLTDALRMSQPSRFSMMVKPVGGECNMSCPYCYYSVKGVIIKDKGIMDEELLESFIKQYIEASEDEASFCWHGGEPLLAGIDFYRKAVTLQEKYKGSKNINNSIQTNGLLIDNEWCRFFIDNGFLIGISIDGTKEIHDKGRLDKRGRPTFDRIISAIEMMRRHGVEYNLMCTISKHSEGHGKEVYRFLRQMGEFIQFMPVFEHLPISEARDTVVGMMRHTTVAPWSVSAEGFGKFMTDVFDEWVKSDVGRIFVQMFDVTLERWYGLPASFCAFSETCGDSLVIEHNGDVFPCDHFVFPNHLLGNINHNNIMELRSSLRQFDFGMMKRRLLPEQCERCRYLFLCNGGCPKHRLINDGKGNPGLNALCEGYKIFFAHSEPVMRKMCDLLDHGLPPSLVTKDLNGEAR